MTLCEVGRCVAIDDTVALSWAASVVPQLDSLLNNARRSLKDAAWLWQRPKVVLYVRGDWRERQDAPNPCVALSFRIDGDALVADLGERGRPKKSVGCGEQLFLTHEVNLFDSGCTFPDGSTIGHSGDELLHEGKTLSYLDEESIAYDGISVSATPQCRWHDVVREACPDNPCRSCRIYLALTGPSFGASRAPSRPSPSNDPACGPCLHDINEALLPRVKRIVRRHSFLFGADDPSSLRFYRSREKCDEAMRAMRRERSSG